MCVKERQTNRKKNKPKSTKITNIPLYLGQKRVLNQNYCTNRVRSNQWWKFRSSYYKTDIPLWTYQLHCKTQVQYSLFLRTFLHCFHKHCFRGKPSCKIYNRKYIFLIRGDSHYICRMDFCRYTRNIWCKLKFQSKTLK